jgi:hypothetical protein
MCDFQEEITTGFTTEKLLNRIKLQSKKLGKKINFKNNLKI